MDCQKKADHSLKMAGVEILSGLLNPSVSRFGISVGPEDHSTDYLLQTSNFREKARDFKARDDAIQQKIDDAMWKERQRAMEQVYNPVDPFFRGLRRP